LEKAISGCGFRLIGSISPALSGAGKKKNDLEELFFFTLRYRILEFCCSIRNPTSEIHNMVPASV
jgi:hypothetical protein